MAMTAGTVTIDSNGVETKTHMAEAIYDAMKAEIEATQGAIPSGPSGVTAKKSIALMARAHATAMVTYMQANAQGKILRDSLTDTAADTSPTPGDVFIEIL